MTRLLLILCYFLGLPFAQACENAPVVTEVYPRANKLPENLLRLYVYFDQPMNRDNALNAIQLFDDNDEIIEGAFLSNKVDLWSPDGHRLTVLFDPGRVKTGLRAHNALGRAIKSGHRYTLKIDSSISNAVGCKLFTDFNKTFTIIDADYSSVDLMQWHIIAPKLNSMDWLRVQMKKPYDHVSLAYRVRVVDEKDAVIAGKIDLGASDSEWRFQPTGPWQDKSYRITVAPMFEDVAGNRLSGSFEQPLTDISVFKNSIEFKPKANSNSL